MQKDKYYKSFDSANFLFELIWKEFPNVKTDYDGKNIKNKLLNTSKDFCGLKNNNYFKIRTISQGGFGQVGTVDIDNKELNAVIFSFSRDGKSNTVFTIKVLAKTNLYSGDELKITKKRINSVSLTDPLSDMVFGSILGHLYDIGINPFNVKYFGTYMCPGNTTSMFIESSDVEVYKLLKKTHIDRITPKEFETLLFQYFYSLFVNKYFFGAVHFDTHLRNLMVTNTDKTEYIYQGKHLNKLKYIVFDAKTKSQDGTPMIIVLRKTKYLLKVIDYGCMLVSLNRSKNRKFIRDLQIETTDKEIRSIGAYSALENSVNSESYANTVDALFTLINLYEYLVKDLDESGSRPKYSISNENIPYINILNNLCAATFDTTLSNFLKKNPQLQTKINPNTGAYEWFMRNHDTGISDQKYKNCEYLLTGLLKYCENKTEFICSFANTKYFGHKVYGISPDELSSIPTDKNSLFLSHTSSNYLTMFNRFEKLLDYETNCISSPDENFKKINCQVRKLYTNPPGEVFVPKHGAFNNFTMFSQELSLGNKIVYKDYNTWLNSSPIPKEKLNMNIGDVKITGISIKNYSNLMLRTKEFMIGTHGLSVPLNNTLENGFFASENPPKVVYNKVKYYQEFYAVLTSTLENTLHLETLTEFIQRHGKTADEEFTIPLKLLNGPKYKLALTLGPILVWDYEIVYKKILHEADKELEAKIILVEYDQGNFAFIYIEGGSFISVGLDTLSTAILCKNLEVKNAVIVSTGFAANILLKKEKGSEPVYVSKSPIRQLHPLILDFSW